MKKEKKRKTPPVDTSLPCSLHLALDDVGIGAILKRLSDGRKAVVVDMVIDVGEGFIVAIVSDKALLRYDSDGDREPVCPSKPNDYKFILVKGNDPNWIVLECGKSDVLLSE